MEFKLIRTKNLKMVNPISALYYHKASFKTFEPCTEFLPDGSAMQDANKIGKLYREPLLVLPEFFGLLTTRWGAA
jgi:hypothetical protein